MKFNDVQASDSELRLILEIGFVLRDAGRLDEAETVFRGMKELLPDSEIPAVVLGTINLRRGRFAAAQALCEEASRVKPDSLYARVHYAEALLFQKQRAEAEAVLEEIIATDPKSPHSRTAEALLEAAEMICATGEAEAIAG